MLKLQFFFFLNYYKKYNNQNILELYFMINVMDNFKNYQKK